MICDLCHSEPECVKVCPPDCLTFLPGSAFDGKHYAAFPPKAIAEALAIQFYPAKQVAKYGKEEK